MTPIEGSSAHEQDQSASRALPTGIATFLMTDIEGSTSLWQRDQDAMSIALARHDALLKEQIERHEGFVIKHRGEGDSLFAVFDSATRAVAAACEIQRAVEYESWPAPIALRVRIALHSGEAELRDGDYVGPPVNRCARLRGIAHGGQILLSGITAELVGTDLPPQASLLPLGMHRLRDLHKPGYVFQLLHPDLPADFPPLQSLDVIPNNLPSPLTTFIGRDRDIAAIRPLLTSKRLLTLTGPGGCGKTRLALHLAAEALHNYREGVWLADLAALTEPAAVPLEVASTLGIREQAGQAIVDSLVGRIDQTQQLLILDNCEHVLDACTDLVIRLLQQCPRLHILATSREGLCIGGEVTYAVPPLDLPGPSISPPPDVLLQSDAVRLFVDRAQLVRPSFTLTAQNGKVVTEICTQLDGSPLALELAAAWAGVLPMVEILAHLERRFDLLSRGAVNLPARHRSLRAAVDSSYAMLDPDQQTFFNCLSVFAGGLSFEAARAVAAEADLEALEHLSALVRKSLVVMDSQSDGTARYRLLETLRAYAWEQAQASAETEAVQRRHAQYFLDLGAQAEAELTGPRQQYWLDQLELEHDNLRVALRWMRDGGELALGLRLCGILWRFWYMRGFLSEGRSQLAAFLEASDPAEASAIRAKALHGVGTLAGRQGDYDAARSLLEQALAMRLALADDLGASQSLSNLGMIAYWQDDYSTARSCYVQSLDLMRLAANDWGIALNLVNVALVAFAQCDFPTARQQASASLRVSRQNGFRSLAANALVLMGLVEQDLGDQDGARRYYEESLEILEELSDHLGIAESRRLIGNVFHDLGDFQAAQAMYSVSLEIARQEGSKLEVGKCLSGLGRLASDKRELSEALGYLEESLGLLRSLGNQQSLSDVLDAMGHVALAKGEWHDAALLLSESLGLRYRLGNTLRIAESIESFAILASFTSEHERALVLAEVASVARAQLHTPRSPTRDKELAPPLELSRQALGRHCSERARGEGAQLQLDSAVALALGAAVDGEQ